MATVRMWPPGLFGSGSGAAWTASSWSLASTGSMVTSASLRQSSRPARSAGLRRVGLGQRRDRKDMRDVVGVDGDQAHRALALERAEPFLDARGRQAEAGRAAATLTAIRSPSCASLVASRGIVSSLPSCFLSTGTSRPPPPGSARKMPSARALALSMILMTRPGVADVVLAGFLDAQQRAVADAGDFAGPRLARRQRCGFSAARRGRPRPIRSAWRSARRRCRGR